MGHSSFPQDGARTDDYRQANNRTTYLLFPDGPFVGEIADTEVNFTQETTIEDAQK